MQYKLLGGIQYSMLKPSFVEPLLQDDINETLCLVNKPNTNSN